MLLPKWSWKITRLLIVVGSMGVLATAFQNCGKASFDDALNSASQQGQGDSPVLANQPPPVEANFNQIGYMSCPLAGKTTSTVDPMSNPYFTVRLGAYDNSDFLSPASAYTTPYGTTIPTTDTSTNVAGVHITQKALDFLASQGGTVSGERIRNIILGSPNTFSQQLVTAFIARDRSPDFLAKIPLASPTLDTISTQPFLNYLSFADKTTNQLGTVKRNFFSQLSSSKRSFLANINFGQSSTDSDQFQADLMNHYLALGYVDAGKVGSPAAVIQNLRSPDSDVTKRIYGRGYALTFGSRNLAENPPDLLGIDELDLAPDKTGLATPPPVSITTTKSHHWSCMRFTIVRDIDRKHYSTTFGAATVIDGFTYGNGTTVPKHEIRDTRFGTLVEHIFGQPEAAGPPENNLTVDQVETDMTAIVPTGSGTANDIHTVCPPEDLSQLSDNSNPVNLARRNILRIARRFLPAEFWQINTQFMCVVPTALALRAGSSCYESGDDDPKFFIKYKGGCGVASGNNECAAFTSICYRDDNKE